MAAGLAIWICLYVLQLVLIAPVRCKNAALKRNETSNPISAQYICKNNTSVVCAMMQKYGTKCKLFKIGVTVIYLTDKDLSKEDSHHQHTGQVKREKKEAKHEVITTLTSTSAPTGKHSLVKCSTAIGLYGACRKGYLRKVKKIVSERREDINCREKWNKTPVMAAARWGHRAVFDFLVGQGCDLSAVDVNHNNVLHVACIGGNIGIVRKLIINLKYDIESRGHHGRTAVLEAARYHKIAVGEVLVSKGCNMTALDDNNNNILHLACMDGSVDMVKYILKLNIPGIDLKNEGLNGKTPLMVAEAFSHKGLVRFIKLNSS